MSPEDFDKEVQNYGIFALISIRDLTAQQVLEEYYDRISIEQFLISPKIFVFRTTLSLSLRTLKGIAISAEVNLS